jgi:hypothetical protein
MGDAEMKIERYYVSGPFRPLWKSDAIVASEGSTSAPIAYLKRPKWIKDDYVWARIKESIVIKLPRGFEVK